VPRDRNEKAGVGYSRLAGADEDRTLSRLRGLRSDLIDPAIDAHQGRIVKRTGDGSLIEFRSVVDAVRCAIEVQNGLIERNAGLPPERRIEFRVGIHLGDVVEESDGDLMGDGVNIAARLESIAAPGAICLSEDAYRQVSGRLDMEVTDLGPTQLKNIERSIRALMIFRAGFALNIVGSFVSGLMPFRAFVAGFLMTTNLANGDNESSGFLEFFVADLRERLDDLFDVFSGHDVRVLHAPERECRRARIAPWPPRAGRASACPRRRQRRR
jgi:Adenylate and Guanylate cyclase catalytic domain